MRIAVRLFIFCLIFIVSGFFFQAEGKKKDILISDKLIFIDGEVPASRQSGKSFWKSIRRDIDILNATCKKGLNRALIKSLRERSKQYYSGNQHKIADTMVSDYGTKALLPVLLLEIENVLEIDYRVSSCKKFREFFLNNYASYRNLQDGTKPEEDMTGWSKKIYQAITCSCGKI